MPNDYMPLQNAEMAGYLAPWYLDEAHRLRDREDAGGAFLQREFERNTQDVATDRDVNRMYSGLSNQASRDALTAQRNARQFLGESGITGGGFTGHLGSALELQRLGQLTQARSNTRQWQMEQNAAARNRRMQAALGVRESSRPSMLVSDALSDILGLSVTQSGQKAERDAAAAARRDARQAGTLGAITNIFSGALGMFS